MNIESNQEEADFIEFAKFIFSSDVPKSEKSIIIDIEYTDDNDTFKDFILDLFVYGYIFKYNVDENSDLKTILKDITPEKFQYINDYIKAIGYSIEYINSTINIKVL